MASPDSPRPASPPVAAAAATPDTAGDDRQAALRRALAAGPTGIIVCCWGGVWLAAFMAAQFAPNWTNWVWLGGMAVALPLTIILGQKGAEPNPALRNAPIAVASISLTLFAAAFAIILRAEDYRQLSAYSCLVVMLSYVIGGLFIDRLYLYLGYIVAALTLVGYFWAGPWYFLYMAVVGGGSLILGGLFLRTLREEAAD